MDRWADFAITAVRYDRNNEYITEVQRYRDNGSSLVDLEVVSRESIVGSINRGMTYVTATTSHIDGKWYKGAPVEIYNDRYIRTSPNNTRKDNLEDLPTF